MQTNEILLKTQYQNAENLSARQAIYKYSTNKELFWTWVAKKYPVSEQSNILEVGCGNGVFWLEFLKFIPNSLAVTLTDYSAGMLEEAKKLLKNIPKFKFETANVENLPYLDNYFDIVLAHYMLYHAHSPEIALLEIKRVMKSSGYCGILLPDENQMQSIFTILECDNPGLAKTFSAEKAIDLLPHVFSSVDKYIYTDTFSTIDVQAILNYIRSLPKMEEKIPEFYSYAANRLHQEIANNGPIVLSFYQYLFIVKK